MVKGRTQRTRKVKKAMPKTSLQYVRKRDLNALLSDALVLSHDGPEPTISAQTSSPAVAVTAKIDTTSVPAAVVPAAPPPSAPEASDKGASADAGDIPRVVASLTPPSEIPSTSGAVKSAAEVPGGSRFNSRQKYGKNPREIQTKRQLRPEWNRKKNLTIVLRSPYAFISVLDEHNPAVRVQVCTESNDYPYSQNRYSSNYNDTFFLSDTDTVDHHAPRQNPCWSYNHRVCEHGNSCFNRHDGDDKSERDALDRNVCVLSMIDRCARKICGYSHDPSHLPSGWWNIKALVDKARRLFDESSFDRNHLASNLKSLLKLSPDTEDVDLSCDKDDSISEDTQVETSRCPSGNARFLNQLPQTSRPRDDSCPEEPSSMEPVSKASPKRLKNGGFFEKSENRHDEPPGPSGPFVLFLALKYKANCRSNEACRSAITEMENTQLVEVHDEMKALSLLASPHLIGVFVADASISDHSRAFFLEKLVQYTKRGGRVVLGGSFCNSFPHGQFQTFFEEAWELPWKIGSRCVHMILKLVSESSNDLLKKENDLPQKYSMTAVSLKGVSQNDAIYRSISDSERSESPVIFTTVGKGRLGYVGDVHWEKGSTKVILAMLGLMGDEKISSMQRALSHSEDPFRDILDYLPRSLLDPTPDPSPREPPEPQLTLPSSSADNSNSPNYSAAPKEPHQEEAYRSPSSEVGTPSVNDTSPGQKVNPESLEVDKTSTPPRASSPASLKDSALPRQLPSSHRCPLPQSGETCQLNAATPDVQGSATETQSLH